MSYLREVQHTGWTLGARFADFLRQIGRIFAQPVLAVSLVCLLSGGAAWADTLSGTVKDPSGGVVPAAQIEISGGALAQPLVLVTDKAGRFVTDDLKPGSYTIRVTKDGFNDLNTSVDLKGTVDMPLSLALATQQSSVVVGASSAAYANSDPVYRQLRDIALGNTYRCENVTLQVDVGTFELKSGTITLLGLVNQKETGAIFIGQAHFSLKPLSGMDTKELVRRTGAPAAEEDINEVVFRFSPDQFPQFALAVVTKTDTPKEAIEAFDQWKHRTRHRHDVPEGMTEALMESETIDNVDADVLAAVYNPKHPPFFDAYMHGQKYKDLRFYLRNRGGAISGLDSPEEVALVNCAGGGMEDGIWYSQHLKTELQNRTASSQQEKRTFATKKYIIETVIGKNDHLASRATITFEPLIPGERVMKFALLPTLRVTRVSGEHGEDLHFIQENRKEDGSFYAILDAAPGVGEQHSISVEYSGDKVVTNAGSGSYYIGARESWYPNLNGFGEKALYDLTFKVPPQNVLISVGKLQEQHKEAGFAVTHWVTPTPVAVAGFNYGQYAHSDIEDGITHYQIAGYYLQDLPDSLRAYQNTQANGMSPLAGMAPGAMTKYVLDQTRAQMQLCTIYFGRAPYDNIYITEQPNFNFGQSWPNLVYLPISAYIDSTQRWMLFGHIDNKFTGFVQEVTPHEVAHQWFGHLVGWASYHDQWLSEGFAEFAAGLFLQQAMGPKWQKDYTEFWERNRTRLLDKNSFGISPNDAGPIWLGLRLISPKSPQAYQGVTYSKGAYILSMLRSIMRNDDGGSNEPDHDFIEMMHDFVETYRDTPASTEAFMAIAEKHMTKRMDLAQNGRLDWFFREWIMGTQVPRYSMKYDVQPAPGGQFKIMVEITQSEVDNNFAMFVPIYADFGDGMHRLAQLPIAGSNTRKAAITVQKQPKKVVINAYKEILER